MKLSLYTLLTYDLSIEESVALAKQTGFDAIDVRMAADGVHLPTGVADEQVKHVRTLADKEDLTISGLTTYYSLGLMSDDQWQETLSGIERSLNLCHILGARFLRCSGPHREYNSRYEEIRTAYRTHAEEIAALAARHKIVVTVEQHGGLLFASAGQILDMMRGLEHEYFGIVYDPGNCISEGYEQPSVQIDMLRPYIKAVHVKNYSSIPVNEPCDNECLPMESRRLDQGALNWAKILANLMKIGYDNYLTLEDFHTFPTLEEKFVWNVRYLRGLLAQEV